jgi:formylglycine-generating enzyme required for sulfatase activity
MKHFFKGKKAVFLLLCGFVVFSGLFTGCPQPADPAPPLPDADELLVLVPGGTVTGDINNWNTDWLYTKPVTIDSFKISKYETSYNLWFNILVWGLDHGYQFMSLGQEEPGSPGTPPTTNKPAAGFSYMDIIVWLNAFSQKTNRAPVYLDAANNSVLKNANDQPVIKVNEAANGYRLPTMAEWEYAARGGVPSNEAAAPWNYSYSGSNNHNAVAWWSGHPNKGDGYPKEVGLLQPNTLGIYDMDGNVWEAVFDIVNGDCRLMGAGLGQDEEWSGNFAFGGVGTNALFSPFTLDVGFRYVCNVDENDLDMTVTVLDLDGLVEAPVVTVMPQDVFVGTGQYSGTIAWKKVEGDESFTGAFAGLTAYKAILTLSANPGYTFNGLLANTFSYDGASVANEADSGIVTIVFPPTTAVPADIAAAFQADWADILNETTDTVLVTDEGEVDSALAAYEELIAPAKALLAAEKTLLDSLKARIGLLKAADLFKEAFGEILAKNTGTAAAADIARASSALAAYQNLPGAVKDLLQDEKALLDELKAAIDLLLPAIDPLMVWVPGGTVSENVAKWNSAKPQTIAAFNIGKTEMKYDLWYQVLTWALDKGYVFATAGREGAMGTVGAVPEGTDKPATNVRWIDIIIWCNAYSEKESKTPVYKVGGNIFKIVSDTVAFADVTIDETADGYRLPSAAEWEYAARGGVPSAFDSSLIPWNYNYAGSNDADEVAWYAENASGSVKPVAGKAANTLGIYDMTGNLWEWVFDGSTMGGGSALPLQWTTNFAFSGVPQPLPLYEEDTIGFRVVCAP